MCYMGDCSLLYFRICFDQSESGELTWDILLSTHDARQRIGIWQTLVDLAEGSTLLLEYKCS